MNLKINTKSIIWWIILIIIIIIILVIIYRKIQKAIENKRDKELVKESDQAIVQDTLTYPKADYKSMADALFLAMDGAGTDEEAIYDTLSRLRTRSDWYALINAFGVRKSSSSSFSGNLVQWLVDELSTDERRKVNAILAKLNVQI